VINDGRDVAITSQLSCGARLPHLKVGEVIGLALYGVGECKEESRALGGERRAPTTGIERTSRRSDGGVNVCGRSMGDLANCRTTCGVAQGEGATAGCPT
jgi:hypothetical protein